jgi:hypothetical protein
MLVAPLLAGICQHARSFDDGVVGCSNGAPSIARRYDKSQQLWHGWD